MCIQMKDGLSKGCADCFASYSGCGEQHCLSMCATNPSGAACQMCIQMNCGASFMMCSGLSPNPPMGDGGPGDSGGGG
jgi:hypothetical protein